MHTSEDIALQKNITTVIAYRGQHIDRIPKTKQFLQTRARTETWSRGQ